LAAISATERFITSYLVTFSSRCGECKNTFISPAKKNWNISPSPPLLLVDAGNERRVADAPSRSPLIGNPANHRAPELHDSFQLARFER
jgi:hypothetical protein